MVEVAIPLTELLKRGQPGKVNLTPGCDDAFRHMKEALVQAPVLRLANPTEMFIAKQKHLGCKKGEANQKQQLSDYRCIHT